MIDELLTLAPTAVWSHFAAISAIPRCSRNEAAVRDYVSSVAQRLGLTSATDKVGNIVVSREASPSHQHAPTIVLQGHLDMVCEKNAAVEHDFSTDPIDLVVDGEWLRADHTTLGADNGIAVAMMLAVLELDEPLGPIECLFTVDEESGLTGAAQFDPALITGRLLINLDSEEEGYFCIGCAGGRNTEVKIPVAFEQVAPPMAALSVSVGGLNGGHSGIEIHRGFANAVSLAGRLLAAARDAEPALRFREIKGGDKHNAIPRECVVVFAVPERSLPAVREALDSCAADLVAECAAIDSGLTIDINEAKSESRVAMAASTAAIVDALVAMPHGVLAMSHAVAGLVETSTNLASARTTDASVTLLTSQRSFTRAGSAWAAARVTSVARLAGGTATVSSQYPAWTPSRENPLADRARAVYRDLFGSDPEVVAVHAGLECGVIGDRIPGMDMVSFGPDIRGAHTPEERLHIGSTERTWRLLRALLASYTRA